MLEIIERAHENGRLYYTDIAAGLSLGYSTLMRWRYRKRTGSSMIELPGPKKVEPLDMRTLAVSLMEMHHGRRRSEGACALYDRYRDEISRRRLMAMVQETREYMRCSDYEIRWNAPGVVWGTDTTEFRSNGGNGKTAVHQAQDLGSRYKLDPLVRIPMTGIVIAQYLEDMFRRYGAPGFIKRDNGSNLNDDAVNAVLEKYMVIPINSPAYYPAYNGGIEVAQKELKSVLRDHDQPADQSAAAVHELNHERRRCLSGRTACEVFFSEGPKYRMTIRQRRDAYQWIAGLCAAIITDVGKRDRTSVLAAWRIACQAWLKKKGFIEVVKIKKVSPHFLNLLSHN